MALGFQIKLWGRYSGIFGHFFQKLGEILLNILVTLATKKKVPLLPQNDVSHLYPHGQDELRPSEVPQQCQTPWLPQPSQGNAYEVSLGIRP